MTKGSYYYYVALNPYMILHGQVWRLLGFLIVPPNANIIFIIFVLMFYYSIGESLVQVWGAFRFNMYIFLGVIATIAASFVVYFIYPSTMIFMDTFYLNLSMFLAYATIFPEMRVYLYGIVPVKVKWLAWVDVALLVFKMGLSTGSLLSSAAGKVCRTEAFCQQEKLRHSSLQAMTR